MKVKAEDLVLAVANSYQQKYFLNPKYQNLPGQIKEEIKRLCVGFVEDVGGILEISFDTKGNLQLKVHIADDDLVFDEIGAELLIKELQGEKEDLFYQLELYFLQANKG